MARYRGEARGDADHASIETAVSRSHQLLRIRRRARCARTRDHPAAPARGRVVVDGTVGLGGHARAMLEGGATRVIGIDRDRDALEHASSVLAPWAEKLDLVHSDYRAIDAVLESRHVDKIDGALADLG